MGTYDPTYNTESAASYGQPDFEGTRNEETGKKVVRTEELKGNVKKLGERSGEMVRQVGSNVGKNIDRAMNATAEGLDKTSVRLSKAATYFRKTDSEGLASDMGEVIRRNPKQSLIVGVVLGILVGRLFK